ncbi:hypothetical protein ACWC0A_03260 [Streptomyces scopuliridis]|uniref:hypothetical protein n=1 Tax=Streptomyces scopuliridis TaxID=452529 RepID=UPI003680FCC5
MEKLMYEYRRAADRYAPVPPPGTWAKDVAPRDVQVGDYIQIDGRYHGIANMRAIGLSGRKILFFKHHRLWVMSIRVTVHRPSTQLTPDSWDDQTLA